MSVSATSPALAFFWSSGYQFIVLRVNRDTASPSVTLVHTIHFIASPRLGPGAGYSPRSTPNVSPRYIVSAADSQIAVPSCTTQGTLALGLMATNSGFF